MRYLINGFDKRRKESIRNYVADEGGYLSRCSVAVAASRGFIGNSTLFHAWANGGVLRIADVYINDDLMEEWQYLLRLDYGSISHLYDVEDRFSSDPSLRMVVVPNPIIPEDIKKYKNIGYKWFSCRNTNILWRE